VIWWSAGRVEGGGEGKVYQYACLFYIMERHDVAVIGLGTAGLAACKTLDEHGVDYIGMDSKKEIGKPIRSTGGVANMFIANYGMPSSDDVVARRIRSIRLVNEAGHDVALRYGDPVGVIYRFTEYENAILRDRSRVMLNTPVLSVKDGVIHTENADYRANNIIIAAGPVSHLLPDDPEYNISDADMIAAYEETRYIPQDDRDDVILYFSEHYAPGGYVWDFADENGKRRVGLGVRKDMHVNLRQSLHDFTATHMDVDGKVDHTIAHLIGLAKPPQRVVFGNVAYAGESAHTTFADTGGGLQLAYGSGVAAAMSIVNGGLHGYQTAWHNHFRPILKKHYKVKKFLYSLSPYELDRVIVAVREYRPRSTNAYKEIPRAALFLTRKLPWLIPRLIGVI